MRILLSLCLSLLSLAWAAAPAGAGGCAVRSSYVQSYSYSTPVYSYPTYVEKVVEKEVPVYVAQYVPFAIAYPAYPVGYVGQAAAVQYPHPAAQPQSQASHCDQKLAELEKKLTAMIEQRAQAAVQPPAVARTADAPHAGTATLFQAKCASCHEAATAGAKGGGFVMFRGNALERFTDAQARSIFQQVRTNKMPKGGQPLTEAELGQVGDWFVDYEARK